MTDFLLELLSEEIPARMQDKARDDLARLFVAELAKAGLKAEALETWATPRRLALVARGLPSETQLVREETKGPRASAPPQALEGFLRKTGLAREQLEERDGIFYAVVDKPDRPTTAVLAEAVPAIVRAFPWPKSMRWGEASTSTESLRWVRPLQGIVALFGEEIVDFEIAGIRSGAATVGHRFHHTGPITIGSANDYVEKLKACHVVVDQDERRRMVRDGAAALAAEAGLSLVEDEGLVAENAGLTEWPVPLLGAFDPAFLQVPPEVIQLTMRTNQKYFALLSSSPSSLGEGDHAQHGGGATPPSGLRPATSPSKLGEDRLAPNFICTANIEAEDGGRAIVQGNQRVLSARLSDAKFFWEQDLAVPLDRQAEKLSQIVFHERLGTVADKVDRVAKLARWLVEEGIVKSSPSSLGEGDHAQHGGGAAPPSGLRPATSPSKLGEDLAALAERAARLCKADLVTQMVGEFPELQGQIGGHLARAQGEDSQVADAIRDHYGTPASPVAVALALADKLDTIREFFGIDERPTGSKDPFALRRAAIQSLLMIMRGLRLDLRQLVSADVIAFVVERWMAQNRAAGGRPDYIAAVHAVSDDGDIWRLGQRMRALEAFVETPEGADLLAGYKRAANILKKEGWTGPAADRHPGLDPGSTFSSPEKDKERWMPDQVRHDEQDRNKTLSYSPEPEEAALIAALDSAEPRARDAVAAEDFEGAMAALASLRAPVDAFFDKVTVNDPDPARREARLDLLARMRDAVHQVADFSRIEG